MAPLQRRVGITLFSIAILAAPLGTLPYQEPEVFQFQTGFADELERPWISADFFANRFQDWRLKDGRVECVEAARREPMRTLQLLTARLSDGPGDFRMSVRTGPLEPWSEGSLDSWAGFLFGAGGEHVDHRLSALVHGRPAEDGGIAAVVDGTGRVAFRDNEKNIVAGSFSIAGPLHEEELSEIKPDHREGEGFGGAPAFEVVLTLEGEVRGPAYTLTLTARERGTDRLLSRARLIRVAPERVNGALAMISHRGPKGSRLGYWFDDFEVEGDKLELHPERAFGPIQACLYTVSGKRLKLTAQVAPLGAGAEREARLQILPPGEDAWRTIALAALDPDAYTYRFVVDPWDPRMEVPYRVLAPDADGVEGRHAEYEGTLRAEPDAQRPFVMAAFSGARCFTGDLRWNHEGVWFPHGELVSAVRQHDPDLLFFAGDQVSDSDLTAPHRTPTDEAVLDYLHRWSRWCWAFGELTRDRPTVCLPDDSDLYQPNLWGARGRHADRADEGGYAMPARFTKVVERTQMSHLPDPVDPEPVETGLEVHFGRLDWGGVSFALLEDRKFKSAPADILPQGRCVDGWFLAEDFDPTTDSDLESAVLLGERQIEFLRDWAGDWRHGTWMKVALSNSVFADLTTLPEGARNDEVLLEAEPLQSSQARDGRLSADAASGAWPQSGRERALRELRRGFAVHIAGDRNLGATLRYGIDQFEDSGHAFSLPAIANPWPRRWLPPAGDSEGGELTGRFLDGFGNKATLLAVANPIATGIEPSRLYDRAPGYGIVRFERATRSIRFECWPRWIDPSHPSAQPYPGWPVEIGQLDNLGPKPVAYLPTLLVNGTHEPVLRVIDESNDELVYSLRIPGGSFRPPVFRAGSYRLELGDPDLGLEKVIEGVKAPAEVTLLRIEL